jgi:hypothetical protein
MTLQSVPQGPFTKGVVASNQPLAQPKGSVQRGSNLILSARGALSTCDGSQLVHAFNNAVQTNRGKFMAAFLFEPIGVVSYYLALAKVLTQTLPLGAPKNLSVSDGGGGGSLPAGSYYYVVTALDGDGGETTASNPVSIPLAANHKAALTWNVVPNAAGYNVYRSNSSGTEVLLAGSALPVSQVAAGTTTVSFTDDGTTTLAGGLPYNLLASPNGASVRSVPLVHGPPFRIFYTFNVQGNISVSFGQSFTIAGCSPSLFNQSYVVDSFSGGTVVAVITQLTSVPDTTGGGGTLTVAGLSPPISDTTQQTALYQMPPIVGAQATLPVNYSDANIVALFPADARFFGPGAGSDGGGGGGGITGGGTGGGGTGGSGSGGSSGGGTVSGGLVGNVSFIPEIVQFTNRAIIALGNGFAPQIFSDPTGTLINPALTGAISSVSVDANGVVTVTTVNPHGIQASQVGANVLLAGILNAAYNTNGVVNCFVIISIPTGSSFKVVNLNAIGQAASSGGTFTVSTTPIISTFTPAYPVWAATTGGAVFSFAVGDLIVPKTQPTANIYLTCIQAGNTGASEPTWPTGGAASVGTQVTDGTIIWQVAGLLNSAAPPPPGAAHIIVYSGALWVFNTAVIDTANGLDGPTCLRMSSIGNPNSWNPVNQAFLDKDDGSEGMGLAKFTITALGIPPEGSLIAFKNWSPYQIIGVFGATNLTIQAVSSNMGCIAPRTIQFVPGFGVARYTHLGIAIFNGVKDELISEQIRPYLFFYNDRGYADITVVDANWVAVSWGSLTAAPPMYVIAVPIGNSGGLLTRIFCYDLVFKAWAIVDLPFAIGTMFQALTNTANPLTILGGYVDGVLQRWQAGDIDWYIGGGSFQQEVAWSFRTLTAASQNNDQRIYNRRLIITGQSTTETDFLTAVINQSGNTQFTMKFLVPGGNDFDVDIPVQLTGKRFDADISGDFMAEIDGVTWEVEPRPAGVVVGV